MVLKSIFKFEKIKFQICITTTIRLLCNLVGGAISDKINA